MEKIRNLLAVTSIFLDFANWQYKNQRSSESHPISRKYLNKPISSFYAVDYCLRNLRFRGLREFWIYLYRTK